MEKKRLLDPCRKAVWVTFLLLAAAACATTRSLSHDPPTPEEHITLGVSYEKRDELDAALKEYKAAAKK